jgi:segregation and condensation protein B
MKKKIKKLNNIVKFPKSLNKLEKQVEAILFAADEPLDVETIEKRVQSTNNIKKILENLQSDYTSRGINLVCIKDKWSFRTSKDLASLMSLQKSTEKKTIKSYLRNFGHNSLSSACN